MFSSRILRFSAIVVLVSLSLIALSSISSVQAQGSKPQVIPSGPSATPTVPANPNPCARTQLQTVQVAASIFYAPNVRAETPYKLKPGSKFFVCISNTNPNWTAFLLAPDAGGVQKPLWTPVNVFG